MPDAIKEITPPQQRLDSSRLLESEFKQALELLRNKNYKGALKKFKWVFSHDHVPGRFLSSGEITNLLKGYPTAVTVIRRWRNDKEKLILVGKVDLPLIRDWCLLNNCLREKDRTIAVFLKLKDSGANERLLHDILNEVWPSFAKTKNYNVLSGYLSTLGFHVLLHATEYDSLTLFPDHRDLSKELRRLEFERHIQFMLTKGTLSYEVALGLNYQSVASEFAKKILQVESSDRAYAGLIKAAIRAGSYEEATKLFDEARSAFSLRRLRKCATEMKRLPKAKKPKRISNSRSDLSS